MKKEAVIDNSFGVSSVILGIMAITFSSVHALIFSIIGLVFAQKQKKLMKNKWSKYGLVLNIIGLILGILSIIILVYQILNDPTILQQLQ